MSNTQYSIRYDFFKFSILRIALFHLSSLPSRP